MKNLQKIETVLSNCQVLNGKLTRAEIADLAHVCEPRYYMYGEKVFTRKNPEADYFFVVSDGLYNLQLKKHRPKDLITGHLFGEIAVIYDQERTGNISCTMDGELLAIHKEAVFTDRWLDEGLRFKLLHSMSKQMAGYINAAYKSDTLDLIYGDENKKVEFKESASKCLRPKIVDAICGMLNSEGGTLLIGVTDDRKVKVLC